MEVLNIFNGIRVIDLGSMKAAYCTKLMADMGAEVIKVEPPEGSLERRIGPFHWEKSSQQSVYFEFYNSNKKFVTLDITSPLGAKVLADLAAASDVLVESAMPGELEALGLGYPSLSKINERLVYVAVTGFGQSGPRSGCKVTDLIAFAMGGLMQMSGAPDKPPVKAPGQQAYDLAGLYGCVGVLMALWEREKSGLGQLVDISMQEVIAAEEHNIAIFSQEGRIQKREGSQHHVAVPGRVFRCKDGYVHVFVSDASPKVWGDFMEWIGSPVELQDEEWSNGVYRRKHVEYVDKVFEQFVMKFTKEELTAEAQKRHIPCVPVSTTMDIIKDQHFNDRKFFVRDGDEAFLRLPFLFSSLKKSNRKTDTALGAHNCEIYRQLLGYEKQDLETLIASKVI